MKSLIAIIALLLTTSLPARSQVVLNSGDTFTFEFTTMPLLGVQPGPGGAINSEFHFSLSDFSQLSTLQVKAFENSLAEAPLCNFTYGPQTSCSYPAAWRDLQGIVQFQLTGKSLTLESMTFHVEAPVDAFSHSVYELSVVPVPEPAPLALVTIAAVCVCLYQIRRKFRSLRHRFFAPS